MPYRMCLEKVAEARILSDGHFSHLKIIYLQYSSGYLNPIHNEEKCKLKPAEFLINLHLTKVLCSVDKEKEVLLPAASHGAC